MKKREVELVVEGLNRKGDGLASYQAADGRKFKVEIPHTVIGDRVRVILGRHHKGWFRAKPEEVLAPGPDRVEPRCKHVGTCGGCRWQQIAYERQLAIKEQFIRDLFGQGPICPIVPCDPPWVYRNKMEFSFSMDRAGNRYLGLMISEGRGRVCNLEERFLVSPWFTESLERVRGWWAEWDLSAYSCTKNAGALRTLTVREASRTKERLVMLTIAGHEELSDEALHAFAQVCDGATVVLRKHHATKGVPTWFETTVVQGRGWITEKLRVGGRELRFKVSATAFFQPNPRQAEKIYWHCLNMAEIQESDLVYDLYCGTGTLAILAGTCAKEVVGFEINGEAVADAQENSRLNELEHVTIKQGDVGLCLQGLKPPDVVLVDPPRPGLSAQALSHLADLRAPKIVYVSCNPETQIENIYTLMKVGYQVAKIQPVDQFPHTPHIENIVLLIKELG